jgi:predicted aspartyl protease
MPRLSFPLTSAGCELTVNVGVSRQREQALKAANVRVPSVVSVRMILDTGATETVIDEKVLHNLGLTPTGIMQILTPSTKGVPYNCSTYDVMLGIYHAEYPMIENTFPVIGSDFSGQRIQGLIGCDVLSRCLMVYDGVSKTFTLAF